MKQLLLRLIRYYQCHRPARYEGVCIYSPSCSEYAKESIMKYGAFRGTIKGMARIMRCNPHSPGGEDLP